MTVCRLLFLLLLILGLPGAGAVGAQDIQAPDGGIAVFSGSVKTPLVIRQGSRMLQLEWLEGRWWVTEAGGERHLADIAVAERLFEAMRALVTVRPVRPGGKPVSGAFAQPLVIQFGPERAEVGGASRIPGLVYVRRPDGTLHLMRPVAPFAMGTLVDRRLFPKGVEKVVELNVTGPSGVLHVSHKYGAWRITAPNPAVADGPAIQEWLDALSAAQGEPVTSGERATHEAVLDFADGTSMTLGLGAGGIVRVADTLFRVTGNAAPFAFPPTLAGWITKEVMRIAPADITGIEVQDLDKTVVLVKNAEGTWVEKGSGRILQRWAKDLFVQLAPLSGTGLWTGSVESLGTSRVEVRFWKEKTMVSSIEVWMGPGGGWWVRGGERLLIYRIGEDLPRHLARLF